MQNQRRITILLGPSAFWILALFIAPLGIMALFSFRAGSFGPAAQVFTLDNYREYFANPIYQRLLWHSALLAFYTAVISIVLAYPLAYYLAFQAGPSRLTMLTLLILPAWTSYLLRILAWKLILGSSGLFSSLMASLGIAQEAAPVLL